MSCDGAARRVIGAVVSASGASAEVRDRLQAIYDQPTKLQPIESGAMLQSEAKLLAFQLGQSNVPLPDHLDTENPRSRAVIRWGRLGKALREMGLSITPTTMASISTIDPQVMVTRLEAYVDGLNPSDPPNVILATQAALGREVTNTQDIMALNAVLRAKGYTSLNEFTTKRRVATGAAAPASVAPAASGPAVAAASARVAAASARAAPALPSVTLPPVIGSPALEIHPQKIVRDKAEIIVKGPANGTIIDIPAALLGDPVNLRRHARWALTQATAQTIFREGQGLLPEVRSYDRAVALTDSIVQFLDDLADDPREESLSPWTRMALVEYAEERSERGAALSYYATRVLVNLAADRDAKEPTPLPMTFPDPPGMHPTPDRLPERFASAAEFRAWMDEYAADMGIIRYERRGHRETFEGTDAEELYLFSPTPVEEEQAVGLLKYALVAKMRMPGDEVSGGAVGPAAPDGASRLFCVHAEMSRSGSRWPSANIDDALDLIRNGSDIRKTDRAGPGTKGTRAVEGLNGDFWTTWR